jgi:hypothetical protein
MTTRHLHLALLLGLIGLLAACTPPRRSVEDDDDAADDDDGSDDDDAADDDDVADDDDAVDDDDDATDDDDVVDDDDDDGTPPDDDDVTPDPTPVCMQQVLDYIEAASILPAETVLGDLPSQQIYSCETYQLQGVSLVSSMTPWASTGSMPSWTLDVATSVSVNTDVAPATLSLTGCAPYACGLYTNTFTATGSVDVTMVQSFGPGNAPFIDVIFGTVLHDVPGQLQSNFIITDCSLGNLNEDLQANGVDIFTVLVDDLGPTWTLEMQLYLYEVELAAEEMSFGCWEE